MNEDEEQSVESVECFPVVKKESGISNVSGNVVEYRQELVKAYHNGAASLADRIKSDGKGDVESLLLSLADEIIRETDHLLGNELIATTNGELRDASVISFKRAEVLEKAIKAVQTRHLINQQSGFDVESPMVMIIFRFLLSKAKDTFVRMGTSDEMQDLFFRMFGEVAANWKKELKENIQNIRNG